RPLRAPRLPSHFPTRRSSDLAGDLMSLAAALINRFRRDRDGADLDQAITHCRRSVELTDDDRPEFVHSLNTLGTALIYRFEHHRSEEHTSELQSRENLVCRPL